MIQLPRIVYKLLAEAKWGMERMCCSDPVIKSAPRSLITEKKTLLFLVVAFLL